MSHRINHKSGAFFAIASTLAILASSACSSGPAESAPPTIAPAQAAKSPPVVAAPDGTVRPLDVAARDALFDPATRSLVVLGTASDGRDSLTVLPAAPTPRRLPLDGPGTALAGGGDGEVFVATRGGYFAVDLGAGRVTRVDVEGHPDTEFTAIARRADGRMTLGSADGAVFTLAQADGATAAVETRLELFARVDDLVTQGDTAVVLDRGQTSVTAVEASGTEAVQALRAGQGATTMVADPAGRVLVADTRGGGLLVYGTDPLILRQHYPVPGAPYGLAASPTLVWVSQTATNTVIGYDLATGIPVEKVRYRTVRQPDSLAFDDASGTLYVVSGAGAGVQVIGNAAAGRR